MFDSSGDDDAPSYQPVFDVPGFWGNTNTSVPTEITKTNIFNVSQFKSNKRLMYSKHVEILSTIKQNQVYYKGPALDQRDADVWIACLSFWKLNRGNDNTVTVKIGDVAKKLGIANTGKRSYDLVRACIDRLYRSNVKYVRTKEDGRKEVKEFHLISGIEYTYDDGSKNGPIVVQRSENIITYETDEITEDDMDEEAASEDPDVPSILKSGAKEVKFTIDINMKRLFENVSWTDFEKRNMLNNNLAKAIEFYAIGHLRGVVHRIKYENLARICGRKYDTPANRFDFRSTLQKALVELEALNIVENYKLHETFVEWVISKDPEDVVISKKQLKELVSAIPKKRGRNINMNNIKQEDLEAFVLTKAADETTYKILLDERFSRAPHGDIERVKKEIIFDWVTMGKLSFVDLLIDDAQKHKKFDANT
jgi:hypothetical protein